jgi:hypothetical protein
MQLRQLPTPKRPTAKGLVCALALLAAACGGGGGNNPTSPSSPSPAPSTSPVDTTTITITSSGVSPKDIRVTQGSRVTFINNDTRAHEMNSDPHPIHTDCPEINDVGHLEPNQSRSTGNLNTVRVCGFHDHINDTNNALKGTITIAAP